jgi:chromosome segregation ATPase
MNVEQLTGEFESTLERARDALTQEISTARATLQKLQRETADASKALGDIHNEHKQAKAELDATLKHLGRASSLVGLDHEIKEARKTLEGLKAEIAKAETAVAATMKQQAEAEAKRVEAWNGVRALREERSGHEARIADLRMKLAQVQLGNQP